MAANLIQWQTLSNVNFAISEEEAPKKTAVPKPRSWKKKSERLTICIPVGLGVHRSSMRFFISRRQKHTENYSVSVKQC